MAAYITLLSVPHTCIRPKCALASLLLFVAVIGTTLGISWNQARSCREQWELEQEAIDQLRLCGGEVLRQSKLPSHWLHWYLNGKYLDRVDTVDCSNDPFAIQRRILDPKGLELLDRFSQLRSILIGDEFSDGALLKLSRLRGIEELSINNVPVSDKTVAAICDNVLKVAHKLKGQSWNW